MAHIRNVFISLTILKLNFKLIVSYSKEMLQIPLYINYSQFAIHTRHATFLYAYVHVARSISCVVAST